MALYFHSEETSFTLSQQPIIKKWVTAIIEQHDCNEGEVNFIFTSNNYLLEINKQYLKHNYFTDVITFNYNEGCSISGDIFISIDQVNLNAKALNLPMEVELMRVLIHGILHLLGHNDKTAEQTGDMRQAENDALKKLKELGWNQNTM